jgi:plastocyanin
VRRAPVLSAVLAATVAASVAAAGVVSTGAAATAPVTARIAGFGPKVVTVKKGAAIRWRNADRQHHSAVALTKIRGRSAFTSGAPRTTDFSATAPSRTGTYRYICGVHPLTMRGTLVVR